MSIYTQTHVLIDPSTEIRVDKHGGWYELVLVQDGPRHSVAVSMGGADDLDRVIAGLIHLRMEHSGIGSGVGDQMPPDPFRTGAGDR